MKIDEKGHQFAGACPFVKKSISINRLFAPGVTRNRYARNCPRRLRDSLCKWLAVSMPNNYLNNCIYWWNSSISSIFEWNSSICGRLLVSGRKNIGINMFFAPGVIRNRRARNCPERLRDCLCKWLAVSMYNNCLNKSIYWWNSSISSISSICEWNSSIPFHNTTLNES